MLLTGLAKGLGSRPGRRAGCALRPLPVLSHRPFLCDCCSVCRCRGGGRQLFPFCFLCAILPNGARQGRALFSSMYSDGVTDVATLAIFESPQFFPIRTTGRADRLRQSMRVVCAVAAPRAHAHAHTRARCGAAWVRSLILLHTKFVLILLGVLLLENDIVIFLNSSPA